MKTPEQIAEALYPNGSEDVGLQEIRRKAFIAGYNHERWVPATKGQPPNRSLVLVAFPSSHIELCEFKHGVYFDDNGDRIVSPITHYQIITPPSSNK